MPKFSSGQWRVVACAKCGFVYLANPPEYERLVTEFAWGTQAKAENKRRYEERSSVVQAINQATRWRLKIGFKNKQRSTSLMVKPFSPGNVLDIGCAGGRNLPPQFVPYGIEISKEAFDIADTRMRARGGYALHGAGADAIEAFDANFFTGVIMSSVLEHEKDPQTVLKGVQRVLAPGGKVYVRVPNFASVNRTIMGQSWCGFRYPDHVNYFTPKTLRLLAEKAGLTFRLLNPLGFFDDNIKALLSKA